MNRAYRGLAAVYDRLMTDVDHDAWAAYLCAMIREALPDAPQPQVIDCGCGTGELSLRLIRNGFKLTGLDLSPDMLLVAGEKLRLAGMRTTTLVCADMRDFHVHGAVDAVVSACDGVNYLLTDEDAARFFASAFAALRPGGILLFDISSAHKLRHVLDGHTYGEDLADCAYIWQNSLDEKNGVLQMDLSIFLRESDGRYIRMEETHLQRAYEVPELCRLLAEAGFSDIRCYDAFTANAPRVDSDRIQFFARRPSHD